MNYVTPRFNTDRYTAALYDIAIAAAAAPLVGASFASGAVVGLAVGVSGELIRELESERVIHLRGKHSKLIRSIATLFCAIVISGLASYLVGLPILGFKARLALAIAPALADIALQIAVGVKHHYFPSKGWPKIVTIRT